MKWHGMMVEEAERPASVSEEAEGIIQEAIKGFVKKDGVAILRWLRALESDDGLEITVEVVVWDEGEGSLAPLIYTVNVDRKLVV